ncbi:MAG: hypothetical protein ABSH06_14250 [Thermodesulfobacteriota bacterium]|jgi:hypothetical protein
MKIEDITEEMIQGMGFEECCALLAFVDSPSEANWKYITLAKLIDKRDHLRTFEWDKRDTWPSEFQSPDWMIAVRESMGLVPLAGEGLENYLRCDVLVELRMQREILKTKGIDESEWADKRLRGENWESKVYESYGLEEPPPTPPHPKAGGKGLGNQPMTFLEPRAKPKPPKRDDPFKDDGFGTLLK